MNAERRKELLGVVMKIEAAIEPLEEANTGLGTVAEDERTAFDNTPESLRGDGEKEEIAETLDDASEEIDSALDTIKEKLEALRGLL